MQCILVDIDGTLAIRGERDPHDFARCGEDEPRAKLVKILHALGDQSGRRVGYFIIVLTGRQEKFRRITELWLALHRIPSDVLLMRKTGDERPDDVVKEEILDQEILTQHTVVAVFDDRQRVVDMWRRRGLLCCQVAPGDF